MTSAVLDASALLALLLGESGAEKVETMLADSAMSTVNLSEVIAYLTRRGAEEAELRQALAALPIEWIPFDEDLAYVSGSLITATRSAGLSFGDRACLALARHLGVAAVTADRSWANVASVLELTIDIIR